MDGAAMILRLILAILLLPSLLYAGQGMGPGPGFKTYSAAPACGSLTFTGAPGDTETFENGAGAFCTDGFAETDPASIIDVYSATQYKDGTHSAYFAFAGAEATINFLRGDFGAGDSGFTVNYWARFSYPANYGDAEALFTVSTHATAPHAYGEGSLITYIADQDGGTNYKVRVYNTSGGTATTGTINYGYNQWIRLESIFRAGGTSEVKVYNASNVLQETLTISSTPAISPRYVYWGEVTGVNQTKIRPFYIDGIQYNSTNP